MDATTAQKRSATDNINPLQHAGILQRVLDYVGPGHWCFVAEVCGQWRDLYKKVASTELKTTDLYPQNIICVPHMTLYSSVFASPSRVRLRKPWHGLECRTRAYQRAAGRHADIDTLRAAQELGMPFTEAVMEGAAHCNTLAVVDFLHAQGCPWGFDVFEFAAARGDLNICAYLHAEGCPWSAMTCEYAAIKGHANILRWLREHGCPWDDYGIQMLAAEGSSVDVMLYLQEQGIVFDADMLVEMLNIAGAYNNLAAAKWLRQQGAEWPEVLCYRDQRWPVAMLDWAGPAGCRSQLVQW
jgi:hypothetical protein